MLFRNVSKKGAVVAVVEHLRKMLRRVQRLQVHAQVREQRVQRRDLAEAVGEDEDASAVAVSNTEQISKPGIQGARCALKDLAVITKSSPKTTS